MMGVMNSYTPAVQSGWYLGNRRPNREAAAPSNAPATQPLRA